MLFTAMRTKKTEIWEIANFTFLRTKKQLFKTVRADLLTVP